MWQKQQSMQIAVELGGPSIKPAGRAAPFNYRAQTNVLYYGMVTPPEQKQQALARVRSIDILLPQFKALYLAGTIQSAIVVDIGERECTVHDASIDGLFEKLYALHLNRRAPTALRSATELLAKGEGMIQDDSLFEALQSALRIYRWQPEIEPPRQFAPRW